MRSSNKSRSRNKNHNQNQNRRQSTNVVNRVFDSSGPEGKVRGTPQQIVEKYQALARDAQLAGDRVAMENFQQHAEHYLRLLNEALHEQNQRREAHEAQQAQHAQQRRDNQPNQNQQHQGGDTQPDAPAPDPQQAQQPDLAEQPQPQPMAVTEAEQPVDSGLVETPENKPKPRRKRAPKKQDPVPEQAAE